MVRLHQLAAAAACLRVALGESYLSYTCDATGCSCNVGFYGQLTATTVPHTGCTMCPAYATTAAAGSATVSLCLCRPGYTAPAGGLTAASKSCVPCATDTFKVARGNAACTACPAHSSTLQASGATSRATCQCDAGYTGDLSGVGTCQACAATEYKLIPGPAACTAIVDCAGNGLLVPELRVQAVYGDGRASGAYTCTTGCRFLGVHGPCVHEPLPGRRRRRHTREGVLHHHAGIPAGRGVPGDGRPDEQRRLPVGDGVSQRS
eukprot:COSAG01_NODE_6635_length_3568_cov_8.046411_3_plen_263_part_00